MEYRIKRMQKQLDDLGYRQILIPEALPLVEKLTADLVQTTESLKKYKQIARDAIEERDQLQFGAEPYKRDNAKLVKECNDLHLTFLQFKEQNEKIQKDLKRKFSYCEKEKQECLSENERLKKRIRDLEFESAKKTDRLLASKSSVSGNKILSKTNLPTNVRSKPCKQKLELTSKMTEEKVVSLTKEINRLKDEHGQMAEANETYKMQIINRDREIERLSKMLEGGRPIAAVNKDCTCDPNLVINQLQSQVNILQKEKSELDACLKEAVDKQHDVMKHALTLADKNKHLENELWEIDQMALEVEADCNTAVKSTTEKANRLESRIHELVLQVQSNDREIMDIKRDKQDLIADLDAIKVEKKHLQSVLETSLEEKKRLAERISQFSIIEHDLNLEIDRLVQTSANQKRKIAELECQLLTGKVEAISDRSMRCDTEDIPLDSQNKEIPESKEKIKPKKGGQRKAKKQKETFNSKNYKKNIKVDRSNKVIEKAPKIHRQLPTLQADAIPCKTNPRNHKRTVVGAPTNFTKIMISRENPNDFNDNGKNIAFKREHHCCCKNIDNEMISDQNSVERLKSERDYYMKEYRRISEQANGIKSEGAVDFRQFCRKYKSSEHKPKPLALQSLIEKDNLISTLQHENKMLAQDKYNLMTRLESARNSFEDGNFDDFCLKSALRKLERERDMLKADVFRLEEERDALRHRLKVTMDTQATERAKMEKALLEADSDIRRLEMERRDLIQCQGSRRGTIGHLEEQCELLKEELKKNQMESNQQKALYRQLKTLHEQTDTALADSQAQIAHLESLLLETADRNFDSIAKRNSEEISSMTSEVSNLKQKLLQLDKEKDTLLISLDVKTERIASLEQEVKNKEYSLSLAESTIDDLRKKISKFSEDLVEKERLLKTSNTELYSVRTELDSASKSKENALQEIRRLHDSVATITADYRCACGDNEQCKRQIDDLKRQLQTYVSEVKRFEDMITQKEVERNKLLDQFKSLSEEASVLENHNHSLENEATQSKVQMSVVLEHVNDLERKLLDNNQLVSDYEMKITDLRQQLTKMEEQVQFYRQQQERTNDEISTLKDLCARLDQQKDHLVRELQIKDDEKIKISQDMLRVRRESETLQTSLTRDRTSLENLEKLLAEAREEAAQQKVYNDELQHQIKMLNGKIEEFQGKLSAGTATATFTYTTGLISNVDNNECNCCKSCSKTAEDKGAVIDTSGTCSTKCNNKSVCSCCGKFPKRSLSERAESFIKEFSKQQIAEEKSKSFTISYNVPSRGSSQATEKELKQKDLVCTQSHSRSNANSPSRKSPNPSFCKYTT